MYTHLLYIVTPMAMNPSTHTSYSLSTEGISMVQGGGVVTVMTSSGNMNLYLAGNPADSTRKPVRCLELFTQYVCVFTHECIYAGFFSLCL